MVFETYIRPVSDTKNMLNESEKRTTVALEKKLAAEFGMLKRFYAYTHTLHSTHWW